MPTMYSMTGILAWCKRLQKGQKRSQRSSLSRWPFPCCPAPLQLGGLQAARQSHLDQEEAQVEAKQKAEEEEKAKQQEAAGEAAQSQAPPAAAATGGGASEATAASAAAVPAAQTAAGISARADASSVQSSATAAAVQSGDQPGSSSEAGPSSALSLVQEFVSDPGKHVPGTSTSEWKLRVGMCMASASG